MKTRSLFIIFSLAVITCRCQNSKTLEYNYIDKASDSVSINLEWLPQFLDITFLINNILFTSASNFIRDSGGYKYVITTFRCATNIRKAKPAMYIPFNERKKKQIVCISVVELPLNAKSAFKVEDFSLPTIKDYIFTLEKVGKNKWIVKKLFCRGLEI
jgi:hypothetical protein